MPRTRERRRDAGNGPRFLALAASPERRYGDDFSQRVEDRPITKRAVSWARDGLVGW